MGTKIFSTPQTKIMIFTRNTSSLEVYILDLLSLIYKSHYIWENVRFADEWVVDAASDVSVSIIYQNYNCKA